MSEELVFELNSVNKRKGNNLILKDISFSVRKREIYIVFGPSGSGKSTLLRLMNRLEDPTSGEIFFKNRPIGSFDVFSLRKRVGMVFQTPVLFDGTVEENLRFGPKYYGIEVDPGKLLGLVGLDGDLLNRRVDEISVGQAQRVMIARALAMKPEVLLLDEPTASLDPASVLEIEDLIRCLRDSLNLTIVFVSHNIDQIKRIGDRGMLLVQGEKVEEGKIEEMIKDPQTEELKKFLRGELK